MTEAANVAVTQADREAAYAYGLAVFGADRAFLGGSRDSSLLVQSFAKHRLAHTSPDAGALREARSRLVWHVRTHDEIRRAALPDLPDGKVYGWMTTAGVVYAGEGYPVSARRFALDNVACAEIMVARATLAPEPSAAPVEEVERPTAADDAKLTLNEHVDRLRFNLMMGMDATPIGRSVAYVLAALAPEPSARDTIIATADRLARRLGAEFVPHDAGAPEPSAAPVEEVERTVSHREVFMRAIYAEVDRQASIGAGMAQTEAETGLFQINMDMDVASFAEAMRIAALASSTSGADVAVPACLHCGHAEPECIKSDDKVHPYRVTCPSCGCGTAHHGDFKAAWAAWKRRPILATARKGRDAG